MNRQKAKTRSEKNKVKITPEGLHLMIRVSNASLPDSFYGKEVYFTQGFKGDTQYLFQALGYGGATPRRDALDKDISIVVISNRIIEEPNSDLHTDFTLKLQTMFNQDNTPYLRMIYMSEDDLIYRLEAKANNFNIEQVKDLISKYRKSRTEKDVTSNKTSVVANTRDLFS